MAIHPIDYRYGSKEMKAIFEEQRRLQRLLDVEAALARAHANVGNIPKKAAGEISETANTKYVKLELVKEIEGEVKHDIMALVLALSEACGEAGRYVHLGATSYDIVDTANALQFKEALGIVERDLYELEGILLSNAEKHIGTIAIGRTHGQHAVPITYGLKFALWAREVRRHLERIEEAKKRVLVGKMSGAVGTMAGLGSKGMEIQRLVMADLGLAAADLSSQIVQRDVYAELLSLLALIAASMDKMGKEIRNLMRTEIGEVSEPFAEKQVGSSAMPHKRNPINSEKVCGLARVIKSNVFVALENVSLEHERDLTNSSAERVIIPESFVLLDEILKTMKMVMKGLVLDRESIERNLQLTKGLNLAEAVMLKLTEKGMPRQQAHELMRQISLKAAEKGRSLMEALAADNRIGKYLNKSEIKEVADPHRYIGLAVEQVREVLKKAKKERK